MIFSEFLKMCKTFFMSEATVSEFMMSFFYEMANIEDGSDENEACPYQKETNSRKASKVYYGERPMSRADAAFMKTHFNEDALLDMVDKLDERIQQNLVDELSKYGIETVLPKLGNAMCDLFRKYMDEMSEKKEHKAKKIKNNYDQSVNESSEEDHNKKKLLFDSHTIELARNFCIDYESQKNLLLLCQIADYIDPIHKHIRSMYTDYLRLNDEVKKAIMALNNIPMLEFESNWENLYLEVFRKDIKALKLVTDKDLLYEGGKYFHNARRYAKRKIVDTNPRIFPAVPMFVKQSDLTNYIDEYIYYMDQEDKFKYVNTPPFDWMIENLGLLSCPEENLTFWMCMFIRSACYIIPREIPARQKEEKELELDEDPYFPTPTFDDVTYMEDLYYLALYALHDLYNGKTKD